ncbi:hypothetical protein V8B97DRAFT_1979889 [Scleroderma yunnanense]
MSDAFNVMIMGETGVGKSSVVNLIAGKPIAEVNPDIESNTTKTTKYSAHINSMTVHLWEMTGFNLPENPGAKEVFALDVDLGSVLADATTVDLVLFCMRGSKVTRTTKSMLDRIKNMFDQVPVLLVITHLERQKLMEDWWNDNEARLTNMGVEGTGHVCVTGLTVKKWSEKYEESRQALLMKLEQYPSCQTRSIETCFLEYLSRMQNFNQRGKKLEKTLRERYKLDKTTAEKLVNVAAPEAGGFWPFNR